MTKTFSIGQILSLYTGKLMCDIGGVYEIADFLAQDQHFTHQLGRAAADAKPWMVESLPWLEGLTLDEVNPENVLDRLAFYTKKFGASHELSPIPHAEELHRNPIEELAEMTSAPIIIADV